MNPFSSRASQADVVISIILIILSVWVYGYAGILITENTKPIAAHTFPRALAVMLAGFSGMLLISSLLKHEPNSSKLTSPLSGLSQNSFVVVIIVSLVVYAVILPITGFIISSLLVMGLWLWLLGIRNYMLIFGFTISVVFVVHYLFSSVLNVPLP